MKSTLTQRLVMALVTVFLLAYVGYQIWRYVTPAYKTETAFTYTVTETASVNVYLYFYDIPGNHTWQ